MKPKPGSYFKLVVMVRNAWMGLAVERLQGPMTPAADKALKGRVHYRHDVRLHQLYLERSRVSPTLQT